MFDVFEYFEETELKNVVNPNKFLFFGDDNEMFLDINKNYLFEDVEKFITDNNYGNSIPFPIGETMLSSEK